MRYVYSIEIANYFMAFTYKIIDPRTSSKGSQQRNKKAKTDFFCFLQTTKTQLIKHYQEKCCKNK